MHERRPSAELLTAGATPPDDETPATGSACALDAHGRPRPPADHLRCPGWWMPVHEGGRVGIRCSCSCHGDGNGWPGWDGFLEGTV